MFDVSGRRIRTLVDAVVESGQPETTWDGQSNDGWSSQTATVRMRKSSGVGAPRGSECVMAEPLSPLAANRRVTTLMNEAPTFHLAGRPGRDRDMRAQEWWVLSLWG